MKNKVILITGICLFALTAFSEEVPTYFKKLDANKDLKVSKEEFLSTAQTQAEKKGREFNEKKVLRNMQKLDLDSDGVVTLKEFIEAKAAE
jgi:Ca2+-binding EF-hand superfamily protein